MNLPPPDGTALSIEFDDGHVEHIPEIGTVDEIVATAMVRIREVENEHGPVAVITPNTNRFAWVSKTRAAQLHAQGIHTVDTAQMSYEEIASMFGET